MKKELKELLDQAGTLVDWVLQMYQITENPYSNGLKIDKVLDDLKGYASNLVRKINELQQLDEKINGKQEDKEEVEAEVIKAGSDSENA